MNLLMDLKKTSMKLNKKKNKQNKKIRTKK
jgi:hypothetical protein